MEQRKIQGKSLDSINDFFQIVGVPDSHKAASKFSIEDTANSDGIDFSTDFVLS